MKAFQKALIQSGDLYHVEFLVIAGNGDPFASKIYRDLIRYLHKLRKQPKLILRTNGLLLNVKNWQMLMSEVELPLYKLEISIDAATKDTYEKLRRGAKFEILMKNLSFIKQLHDEGKIARLSAIFVVQKDNYQEIPVFI